MTCIVAITDGEKVVLGADSAGVGGSELRLRADPKIFQLGSYAIGFTTSFRMGQILRYETDLPEPPTGATPEDLERFLVTEFVPTVRGSFADHGFAKKARFSPPGTNNFTEEGQDVGGLFLVGVAGHIFEIQYDYQLARPLVPYSAVGTGASIALGALYALTHTSELSLHNRAMQALEAAETFSTAVRGPFHFIESPAVRNPPRFPEETHEM
jgi:hypothetical protein